MKTGMQPASTASVSLLLDAVSPGGMRQNVLRCIATIKSSYGNCTAHRNLQHLEVR